MGGPGPPSWFTPGRLLLMFCVMNLFIYIDRGVIASNGVNGAPDSPEKKGYGIQGDFGLSLFQDGLLPAAFMVGLLVSSPVFAEASKHYNAFRLIGTGLGVWTLAVVGCGLSVGFVSLLLCRMAVGVGEASFVALASPFIDDNAPPNAKTRWLAIFYLCIPTGYALGYIFGGLAAAGLGWRAPFLLQGAAMVPFVAFCLRAPPIDIHGTHSKQGCGGHSSGGKEDGSALGAHSHSNGGKQGSGRLQRLRAGAAAVWQDLVELCRHPVYVLVVGGMTCYTAVLGTFAFYGPKAGRDVFKIGPETADLAFGAITVLTGVLGTLAGGLVLDIAGSSLRNALLLCAAGTAAGFLLIAAGFLLVGSFGPFAVVLSAGEFAMFMTQAPSNAICMWAVPPGLRPFAMSMMVVAMHMLGDVPGPPLLGMLQGKLGNWRVSMALCSTLLLVGAGLYLAGIWAPATDYRNVQLIEEEEDGGEGGEGDEETGLDYSSTGGGGSGGGSSRPPSREAGASSHDWGGSVGGGGAPGGAERAPSGRLSPERPLLQKHHAYCSSSDSLGVEPNNRNKVELSHTEG